MRLPALFFLLPLLACTCRGPAPFSPPSGPASSSSGKSGRITRDQVMATAERYASYKWLPSHLNVRHGLDPDGIRVDTPDLSYQKPGAIPGFWKPGRIETGIPYQWGGFATPEQFDRDLAAGLAAGDVYTSEKRARLDDAVSRHATGIDCSGFISRCWNLERSYSTRELESLCDVLPSWDDLRPGDVLNLHNAHVLLFIEWADPQRTIIHMYETGGPPDWKVIRHLIRRDVLDSHGYRALRYRGIRE